MSNMFCYQCEQTAGGKGCVGAQGVCGKKAPVALLQDELTEALIGLARVSKDGSPTEAARVLMREGLFAAVTNVNFDDAAIEALIARVRREKEAVAQREIRDLSLGENDDGDMAKLWSADEDIRSLKSLILFG
ncbi:MAG: hydroxylamine reductase, partial [Synergistaceae bacterium]|nr:hydroxylamine reductase [Synergistaceae bacterium]